MGEVWIKLEMEVPWGPWLENPGAVSKQLPINGRTVRNKYCTDQQKGPWFWFWEFGPWQGTRRHTHQTNEVLYIQEGEITFEGKVCGPGTLVYIEKDTQYGPFWAGPAGAKGMNIRAAHAPATKLVEEKASKSQKRPPNT